MLGQAFVYGDGELPSWALLGEYDNGTADGKGRTEYVWLPTEGGAIPVGLYREGRFYAMHSDHLGAPRGRGRLRRQWRGRCAWGLHENESRFQDAV